MPIEEIKNAKVTVIFCFIFSSSVLKTSCGKSFPHKILPQRIPHKIQKEIVV